MRQEFDSAIELCSKAGEISNNSDSQAASCVGVAATHLGLKVIQNNFVCKFDCLNFGFTAMIVTGYCVTSTA